MNLKKILTNEYNYPDKGANIIIEDLSVLSPETMIIFKHWEKTRDESNSKEFYGYSIDIFRKEWGFNFFAALLTLDSLIKNPMETIESLNEGYDSIIPEYEIINGQPVPIE